MNRVAQTNLDCSVMAEGAEAIQFHHGDSAPLGLDRPSVAATTSTNSHPT
ncbi:MULTISPECIES: hypothetical protein [Pandoraea]|nr:MULTISPECIES: hypothetical protein [Pandoraea]